MARVRPGRLAACHGIFRALADELPLALLWCSLHIALGFIALVWDFYLRSLDARHQPPDPKRLRNKRGPPKEKSGYIVF
jgi:hypothetical protein